MVAIVVVFVSTIVPTIGVSGRSYPVAFNSTSPTLGANLIKFGLDPMDEKDTKTRTRSAMGSAMAKRPKRWQKPLHFTS